MRTSTGIRSAKGLTAVGGLTAVAAAGVLAWAVQPTNASAGVHNPCPSGMVCIYKGTDDTTPIIRGYYQLGAHHLRLDQQKHLVVNRLWDKRKLTLKDKSGAKIVVLGQYGQKAVDFTTVRTVVLQRPCPIKTCFTKVPQ
jgi:hypothetical protein